MKFSICNETYQQWPFARVCEDVAACGYDGVEIAPSTLDEDPGRIDVARAEAYARCAVEAGLAVVGMHWLLMQPAGLHLTSPDDAVRRRTTEHLCHLARICAAMGGEVLVLGSPTQRSVRPGDRHEAAFERAAEVCREVAATAGEVGVTLAVEPLAPAYTNFLTSAAEARRLIQAVDHPACRLHLDVCAMSAEEEPIETVIRRNAGQLVHFHANDPNLRGPGTGSVEWRPIVQALRDIDYAGWVSVEVFDYTPDGPTIARQSLEFLREVFER